MVAMLRLLRSIVGEGRLELEVMLQTVAALTHIFGREPTIVDINSMFWSYENAPRQSALVALIRDPKRNSLHVRYDLDVIEKHVSRTALYAVIGYCTCHHIDCHSTYDLTDEFGRPQN
jgi:hypothetical protein